MTERGVAAIGAVRGRLIVSVQADVAGAPLDDARTLARIAEAVVLGGAGGIRCGGVSGIGPVRAIALRVDVPVIGLWKVGDGGVYITPTVRHARAVAAAGADIVAIDGTARPRRDGSQLSDQVRAIHAEGASVMADVAGLHDVDGVLAAGVDVIATTLSGYVDPVTPTIGPDIDLVAAITRHTSLPVIAEGRFTTPDQVRAAFDAGAHAVVVGKAITSPTWLTAAFLA